MSKWVMRANFKHIHFNNFPTIWKTPWAIAFWPLQSLSEHLRVHRDSNSQHGSSLGSVMVLSLTLFCNLGKHENVTPRFSLGLHLYKPFCPSCEPKVRVVTLRMIEWPTYDGSNANVICSKTTTIKIPSTHIHNHRNHT